MDRDICAESDIPGVLSWVRYQAMRGLPGGPVRVTVGRAPRTLDQNAKLWAMLGDMARQVVWHGLKLTPEEWKDVLTAALKRQRAVPGIDGGFVVLGAHTSKMNKQEFAELLDLVGAFGAQQGVRWTETRREEP